MAAALHEAMENLDRNAAYVTELRRTLEDKLSRIPESRINGDRALRLPGTLNMCFAGIEGESLLLLLDQAGIAASSGSACTSGSLDPSHVLLAIGVPVEVAHGSLRLSLSGENTRRRWRILLRRCPGWWRICAPSARFGSKCKTRKRKEQEREDGFVFR